MTADLINFIIHFSYFAIFSLVFLQEIGVPNFIPNEFVLLFAGYLTYNGTLSLPLAILTAVAADVIGTTALYIVFLYFGKEIVKHKPRWIPIDDEKIKRISNLISSKALWGIYLGRLIPFVRGYTSVAAGLVQVKMLPFLSMVILSAVTWSGGYVIAGRLLGSEWQKAIDKFHMAQGVLSLIAVLIIGALLFRFFYRQIKQKTNSPK